MHTHLGPEMRSTLLGFHAITGCDQTGRFSGFTKYSCWKVLMNATQTTYNALQSIGAGDYISDETKNGLKPHIPYFEQKSFKTCFQSTV